MIKLLVYMLICIIGTGCFSTMRLPVKNYDGSSAYGTKPAIYYIRQKHKDIGIYPTIKLRKYIINEIYFDEKSQYDGKYAFKTIVFIPIAISCALSPIDAAIDTIFIYDDLNY